MLFLIGTFGMNFPIFISTMAVTEFHADTRGAINGLMEEIIEDHARAHVADPALSEEARARGVEELLEAIRRYSK